MIFFKGVNDIFAHYLTKNRLKNSLIKQQPRSQLECPFTETRTNQILSIVAVEKRFCLQTFRKTNFVKMNNSLVVIGVSESGFT